MGYDRDHDYNLDVSGNRAEGDRDSMGNGNGNGSGNRDRSSRSSRSIAGNGIIPRVAGLGEAGQIDGIGTMEKWAEEVVSRGDSFDFNPFHFFHSQFNLSLDSILISTIELVHGHSENFWVGVVNDGDHGMTLTDKCD